MRGTDSMVKEPQNVILRTQPSTKAVEKSNSEKKRSSKGEHSAKRNLAEVFESDEEDCDGIVDANWGNDEFGLSEDEKVENEDNEANRRQAEEENAEQLFLERDDLFQKLVQKMEKKHADKEAERELKRKKAKVTDPQRGKACTFEDNVNSNAIQYENVETEKSHREIGNDPDLFELRSPSNTTVYISADKFRGVDKNQIDSSDTSYGSSGEEMMDTNNSEKSKRDSTKQIISEENKRMFDLISELQKQFQTRLEERPSTSDGRSSATSGLSVDKVRKCMNEQEERERRRVLDKMVTDAEKSKAEIFKPTGRDPNEAKDERNLSIVEMDDDFFHHTAHIDSAMIQKIEKGEDVDLAKLLPKERILHNDGRLQMIQKNEFMQLIPMAEKDTPMITSLRR